MMSSETHTLPTFKYHPDPIASGSITRSNKTCRACGRQRGFIYAVVPYAEEDLTDALCPWCIADGSAHATFDATFVDSEAFPDGAPIAGVAEVTERTPGYAAWQTERWPACCGDLTAFIGPLSHDELNTSDHYELVGAVMSHIVHDMKISGGAATRLFQSLKRDHSPTLFVFRCLTCNRHHLHIDSL